jgi:leader peptidase (prepilin peptidase)/N-methyltransferase
MSLLEALQNFPVAFIAAVSAISLAVGSFLNVVIHRLPKMLEREWRAESAALQGTEVEPGPRYNLIVPRSQCPSCGHVLSAIENIPLLSYLALRGKCHACKARIPLRYPLVETLTVVFSAFIAWHYGYGWQALAALGFTWALLAAAFIDLDTYYLPDNITLPLLWGGLLVNLGGTFADLQAAVIGAAAGYLVLWSVFWAFKLLTSKEGMGYGDFKLAGAIGAWLGWKLLPAVILIASVAGAVIGILMIVLGRRERNVPIPFGPFLAIAGIVAMLWGNALVDYYLRLL